MNGVKDTTDMWAKCLPRDLQSLATIETHGTLKSICEI